MNENRFILLALSLLFALPVFAGDLEANLNLGSSLTLPLDFGASASSGMQLSIEPGDLADSVKAGDILFRTNATLATINIQTKTSAPSFQHKKFVVQAKDPRGNVLGSQVVDVSVAPIFVVTVTDAAGSPPSTILAPRFDFDSDPNTEYFRSHENGLQLIFKNNASQSFTIHGSGVIQHAMASTPPGQNYEPALILPSAGENSKGYYTFHGIYTPSRNAIFNATQIPAVQQ